MKISDSEWLVLTVMASASWPVGLLTEKKIRERICQIGFFSFKLALWSLRRKGMLIKVRTSLGALYQITDEGTYAQSTASCWRI